MSREFIYYKITNPWNYFFQGLFLSGSVGSQPLLGLSLSILIVDGLVTPEGISPSYIFTVVPLLQLS